MSDLCKLWQAGNTPDSSNSDILANGTMQIAADKVRKTWWSQKEIESEWHKNLFEFRSWHLPGDIFNISLFVGLLLICTEIKSDPFLLSDTLPNSSMAHGYLLHRLSLGSCINGLSHLCVAVHHIDLSEVNCNVIVWHIPGVYVSPRMWCGGESHIQPSLWPWPLLTCSWHHQPMLSHFILCSSQSVLYVWQLLCWCCNRYFAFCALFDRLRFHWCV